MDNAVVTYLKSKQIPVLEENIESKLSVWNQYYKGKVDGFHSYKVYQGKKHCQKERMTLNLPLRVCQRWADLLLNEKCDINIEDAYTNEAAHRLLRQVNFKSRGNNLIQAAFACGGGFFIQFWDGKKTNQKYVTQDYFYPISYESGILREAAFASQKTIEGKTYTYLETHLLDAEGFYVVDNALLETRGQKLVEVSKEFYTEHDIAAKVETHSKTPLFQFIRPNIANRDSFNSPFGVSVFDGATDLFKVCDAIYDSYYKEFLLGKKRIFVKDGVSNINFVTTAEGTKQVAVFDPNDEVFYHLNDSDKDMPPLQESNLELRITEHDMALQTNLNLVSQAVGFGSNGFKWENGSVATATQIISQNSEMFRTLKKHEILLSEAIEQMVRGLLHIEKEFGKDSAIDTECDITVDFDDSIIEDTAEIKRQAMLELNAGLIDPVQYYVDVYKMTEEQAIQYYDKIQARKPSISEEPDGV